MLIEILFDITNREGKDPTDNELDTIIPYAINNACTELETAGFEVTYKLIKVN